MHCQLVVFNQENPKSLRTMNVESLIKALNEFAVLQNMNVMIANDPKAFGLRERIIYITFFESAALLMFRNTMSAKEIESYMRQSLFSPDGICRRVSHINFTESERHLAESLLVKEDPSSVKVSTASADALGAFVLSLADKNVDCKPTDLARLIADKTIFSSIDSNPLNTVDVTHLEQEEQPMNCVATEQRVSPGLGMLFMLIVHYLPGICYGIGAIALVQGAGSLKGWIIGFVIGTWWSRGGVSAAIQGQATGHFPDGSISFAVAVHWIFMLGLLTCSIISFAQ